ncbi:hypothetical protein [Sporosarcina sp. FSL K6-5500]|uniref:hypothetical protein n=1 Tax=Sporosarcina sp. FSL K6-5500 TaxID=2921558 RepID=UPI0030F936D9
MGDNMMFKLKSINKGENNMPTKENPFIQHPSEIFRNIPPSSRYEVILKTASDVINNTARPVMYEITMEASSLVDEKAITILPEIQKFMHSEFDGSYLVKSDIVNEILTVTYCIDNHNYPDSLSVLISNELRPIHNELTKLIEANLLTNVKIICNIASFKKELINHE